MNRQTDTRSRAAVTFAVFILLTVAVIATQAGDTGAATYSQRADGHRDAPLIVGLIGLARHLHAREGAIDPSGT